MKIMLAVVANGRFGLAVVLEAPEPSLYATVRDRLRLRGRGRVRV